MKAHAEKESLLDGKIIRRLKGSSYVQVACHVKKSVDSIVTATYPIAV